MAQAIWPYSTTRAAWRRFFQEFDVLIGPMTLDAAFPHQVGSFETRTLRLLSRG